MRIRPCSSSIPPPLCVCASWDVCGAASLGTSPHLTMWRSPCLQVNGSADKQGPKQAKHVRRPVVLFITGVPGSGKTTFVKEQIFGVTDRDGPVDLVRWPLRKEGTMPPAPTFELFFGSVQPARAPRTCRTACGGVASGPNGRATRASIGLLAAPGRTPPRPTSFLFSTGIHRIFGDLVNLHESN